MIKNLPNGESIRIGTMAGKGLRTAEYIGKILHHGFESFQINFFNPETLIDWRRLSHEVNAVLVGSEAVVSSIGVYANPLGDLPQDAVARNCWETAIDTAAEFGTNLVCGFTGRLRGVPIDQSIGRFKEVFGPLARRAEDQGVRICFENCPMNGNWASGDYNLAHNPDAWELLFDAVPSEALGLEWEPCHQICQGINPLPQLRQWVSRIFHVHGKDANFYPDVMARSGFAGRYPVAEHRHPGFGDTDWTLIISELRRGGFSGSIDIEGWHDPVYHGELELTGQVAALHYLKACRKERFPNPEGF